MWIFGKKRNADTYEKELVELQKKIAHYQQRSATLKQRLRRAKGFVTLYLGLVYAIWAVLVGHGVVQANRRAIIGMALGPPIIFMIRWMIQKSFDYLIKSSDNQLETLNMKQGDKIEEFKQKTDFYSTQALLKRFEQSAENDAENNERIKSQKLDLPGTELPSSFQTAPYEPYVPRWYDRLLDVLVGEDENSPKNRYALICGNCRNHNGLAQYGEDPQYIIYICPHCGFINGKERNQAPVQKIEEKPTEEQENDKEEITSMKEIKKDGESENNEIDSIEKYEDEKNQTLPVKESNQLTSSKKDSTPIQNLSETNFSKSSGSLRELARFRSTAATDSS